jgi:polyisoprenoid-binding protein YceI
MNYRRIVFLTIVIAGIVALLLPQTVRAETETYMIDKVHSMANFKIRHLFSKVSGTFSESIGIT